MIKFIYRNCLRFSTKSPSYFDDQTELPKLEDLIDEPPVPIHLKIDTTQLSSLIS